MKGLAGPGHLVTSRKAKTTDSITCLVDYFILTTKFIVSHNERLNQITNSNTDTDNNTCCNELFKTWELIISGTSRLILPDHTERE